MSMKALFLRITYFFADCLGYTTVHYTVYLKTLAILNLQLKRRIRDTGISLGSPIVLYLAG